MSPREASRELGALDLQWDFDGLSKLIETAFAEDFQRARTNLLGLFKRYGFVEVSTLHQMGLRLKQAEDKGA